PPAAECAANSSPSTAAGQPEFAGTCNRKTSGAQSAMSGLEAIVTDTGRAGTILTQRRKGADKQGRRNNDFVIDYGFNFVTFCPSLLFPSIALRLGASVWDFLSLAASRDVFRVRSPAQRAGRTLASAARWPRRTRLVTAEFSTQADAQGPRTPSFAGP